jgi:hypothetical protein
VKSVSETADLKTWTAVVRLKDGRRLPDLKTWERELRASVGQQFTIVGVEATIDGRLVEVKGGLSLRLEGSDEVLRLGKLRRKVQWDPTRKRPQPATRAEREAHQRLLARWAKHAGPPPRVRIIGPLRESAPGELPVLTVREFVWD